jgi:hypothetical protein
VSEEVGFQKPGDVIREQEDYIHGLENELNYWKQLNQNDSYRANPMKTKDEEFLDRILKHRIPALLSASGCDLWVIRSEVVEILALLNISKVDYNRFSRDWADIEDLSQGGGNKELVAAELEEFFFNIQLYRSRGDNEVKSYTERSAHFTNKSVSEQTVKMPQNEQRTVGMLDIFRRK